MLDLIMDACDQDAVIERFLIAVLRGYKLAISPFLAPSCRFYPTCADYAAEAVERHGALRGSAMAARRLCKCHPWHDGGFDPVPDHTPKLPS